MHRVDCSSTHTSPKPSHLSWYLSRCAVAVLLCGLFVRPSLAGETTNAIKSEQWADHPALEQFGVAGRELPSNLFLVKTRGSLPDTPGIQVHGEHHAVYLVSGDPAIVRDLAQYGYAMIALKDLPAASPPVVRHWTRIDTPDPAVEEMVSQVEWRGIITKIQKLVDFGTRHTFAANQGRVARSIRDTLRSYGLEAHFVPYDFDGVIRWNVEAIQPGTRFPNSCVIICGHFDSINGRSIQGASGADDNASGTAAVLTAAEILSQYEFDYSIRYVCFSGEEQGLVGSAAYAAAARSSRLDIIGALNFDMVGFWTPGVRRDLEIEANQASKWLADAVINAADLYTEAKYELHVYNYAWWGDHFEFWSHGYPAVNHEEAWDWYDPDFNPYYHTSNDLPEHLDSLFTVNNIKVAVAALASIADAEAPLPVAFDMRPGSCPNPFNPKSQGIVRALLLGSAEFDVTGIQLGSVSCEQTAFPINTEIVDMGSVHHDTNQPCAGRTPDGFDDLLLTFSTPDVAAALGTAAKGDTVCLHLTGQLRDGTAFEGRDVVTIAGNTGGPMSMEQDIIPRPDGGETAEPGMPAQFALHQNVPNPFNPATTIRYDVPDGGAHIALRIYDVNGGLVRTLEKGFETSGRKSAMWNGLNDAGNPVATGIYIYRLTGPAFEQTRKMILLK